MEKTLCNVDLMTTRNRKHLELRMCSLQGLAWRQNKTSTDSNNLTFKLIQTKFGALG